jgi:integrase/recombinase XerC
LSEVAGLQLADINLRNGSAKIRGKGNKERLAYYSEGCTEALMKWLAVRGEAEGALFWLEVAGIKMLFKRIKTETGLPLLHPHQLRHTALTMLVRDGVDLHSVKRLAGHASVTTTEAYLALASTDVQEKHRSASPFDKIRQRSQPIAKRRRLKSA